MRSPGSICRWRASSSEARSLRHELVPLLWCQAQPSGHVTRDAFERVSALMVEATPHGRRDSTRSISTCTARWSRSTSTTPMASCCVASASSAARGCRSSRAWTSTPTCRRGWRRRRARWCRSVPTRTSTWPTRGARAARCLHDLLGRPRPAHALEQIDFLMPLTSQSTLVEPMRSLMDEAIALERAPAPGGRADRRLPGRPTSRNADRRSTHAATTPRQPVRRRRRSRIGSATARASLRSRSIPSTRRSPSPAARLGTRPAADPRRYPGQPGRRGQRRYDDPHRGRMIASRIERVLAGIICDPAAAARAHEAGIGATVALDLGSRSGTPGDAPLASRLSRRSAGRRPVHGHGTVLPRLALRAWSDGAARDAARCESLSRAASNRPPTRRCSAISAWSRRTTRSCCSRAPCTSGPISARWPAGCWSSRDPARTCRTRHNCRFASCVPAFACALVLAEGSVCVMSLLRN